MSRPTAAELLRESKAIRRWLRCYGVAPVDVEDMTAEAVVAAWEIVDRGGFRPHPNAPDRVALLAFLRAIVRRKAGNFRRLARHREEVLVSAVAMPERLVADLESALLAADELRLLEKLKPKARAVLVAVAMGCGIPEIAASLGIPEATAWTRLRQARIDLLAVLRRRGARER